MQFNSHKEFFYQNPNKSQRFENNGVKKYYENRLFLIEKIKMDSYTKKLCG